MKLGELWREAGWAIGIALIVLAFAVSSYIQAAPERSCIGNHGNWNSDKDTCTYPAPPEKK